MHGALRVNKKTRTLQTPVSAQFELPSRGKNVFYS